MEKENKVVSSSGSRYYTPIEYVYDEELKLMVPKFGKKLDRYAMIQASKPSCDINYIVKRALAGDYSALNVRVPNYADISDVPDNLNDLHAFNAEALNNFYKLDPNIRKLFNNNVDTFIEALNNGTYAGIISNALNIENSSNENKSNESEGE